MSDPLPMSGNFGPRREQQPEPTTGPKSRTVWSDRDIAGWLKKNSPDPMTLTEAWRMSDKLCKGPLADVWLDGARRGCSFQCDRVE